MRTTKRTNKDGPAITHCQIAHNERDHVTKKPVTNIIPKAHEGHPKTHRKLVVTRQFFKSHVTNGFLFLFHVFTKPKRELQVLLEMLSIISAFYWRD